MSTFGKTGRPPLECFERSGFAIVDGLLPPESVTSLLEATREYSAGRHDGVLDRNGEVYGCRDLLWRVPGVLSLASSPEILSHVQSVLGPMAFPVRGLFFDKTLKTNWGLPWHQDLTVAVSARRDVPGFGPWTAQGRDSPRTCTRQHCWDGW